MDGLALIEQATEAGLKLTVVDGRLTIKGPRRLEGLANVIISNKDSVIGHLIDTSPTSIDLGPALCSTVGVTETPTSPAIEPGFADKVSARRRIGKAGQPALSSQPTSETLADPTIICPRCMVRPVLRELREMTGGLCYPCWITGTEAKP
jgi:hypothetical protein